MLNRTIQPNAPVTMYKTYQIAMPRQTHFRKATCEEVGCSNYKNGWITRVPSDSELEGIVRSSGRKWVTAIKEGAETVFTFAAGTICFQESQHAVPLDRPALFIVKDGDFRGNPTGRHKQHTRPEFWVEDFSEHLDNIAKDRD